MQSTFADVWNVAGKLLTAELRVPDLNVVFFDVNGGVDILLHEFFADDDGVFKVKSIPRHKAHEHIAAESQLALVGGRTIRQHIPLFNLLAEGNDRLLVLARSLVEPDKLSHLVDVGSTGTARHVDFNPLGVEVADNAFSRGSDDKPRVHSDVSLHAGGNDWRLSDQERHSLSLHVGAHQRSIGIVVFKERN